MEQTKIRKRDLLKKKISEKKYRLKFQTKNTNAYEEEDSWLEFADHLGKWIAIIIFLIIYLLFF